MGLTATNGSVDTKCLVSLGQKAEKVYADF